MKNKLLLTAIFGFLMIGSLFEPSIVKADSYSNDDNRKTLSIDKKIRSLNWSYFIDNISTNKKVFKNGELIEFKIKVTNTGTTNMKNIKVVDTLPPFLKLVFFPGSYDTTNNKIQWTIDELNAGNSQEFLVRAKIDKANEVNTLTKETNVALASVDEINEKDDATYYIGKGSVATESAVVLPETGSLALVFETIGVVGVGLSGLALRKKIRGF